ncbi:MAG: YmdB family metallophosphoesterase [Rhodospirillales bacterium]|nr:YmdB family metallophosphoesterase [Rhodospirillales bacterium]MCW8861941.1 YmdB family metallophosphoesterase [Rhodospirillales bacterium]
MRILYCGDVVGRSGRTVLIDNLPKLRERLSLDVAIVNGENAARGFGITEKICKEFYAAGADVITTGNHVWDQRELLTTIGGDARLIRPLNFPADTPGRGACVIEVSRGRKVLVAQVMGRLFMEPNDCPFAAIDREMTKHRLSQTVHAAIVDIHADATSEKMAMGHWLDGRVSLVAGTHSHIPTGDAQILPGGTAYQTDLGMCGDYDSVIGMKKEAAIARFTRRVPTDRLSPAEGEATLCGVFVETDDTTGLALRVEPVRLGGRLAPYMPDDA